MLLVAPLYIKKGGVGYGKKCFPDYVAGAKFSMDPRKEKNLQTVKRVKRI